MALIWPASSLASCEITERGRQLLIGSPGRTSRMSPSVIPQPARVVAGIWPTISTTSSGALVAFMTASLAFSSSPTATKNHCSKASSTARCFVNKRTTRPSVFCCIRAIWHAWDGASTALRETPHVPQLCRDQPNLSAVGVRTLERSPGEPQEVSGQLFALRRQRTALPMPPHRQSPSPSACVASHGCHERASLGEGSSSSRQSCAEAKTKFIQVLNIDPRSCSRTS